MINKPYPNPSDSGKLADIIYKTISNELQNSNKNMKDTEKAVEKQTIRLKSPTKTP